MPEVERHAIDGNACRAEADYLTGELAAAIDGLERGRGSLKAVLHHAVELLQHRSVADPTGARIRQDLRTAAQAATALFAAATGAGEVEATVTRPLRFRATGPASAVNAGHWLTGLRLAVIAREEELVQRLCAVPLDTLRASGVEHDAFLYPWVETLQAFLTGREITPDLFGAVMDGTDPDTARVTPRRAMLQVVYPPIEMFYYLLRRDQQKFTASTVRALEQHRQYWTSQDAADPNGFLALEPLAVAVLARRAGMTVDVQSGYLPKSLLLGELTSRSRRP